MVGSWNFPVGIPDFQSNCIPVHLLGKTWMRDANRCLNGNLFTMCTAILLWCQQTRATWILFSTNDLDDRSSARYCVGGLFFFFLVQWNAPYFLAKSKTFDEFQNPCSLMCTKTWAHKTEIASPDGNPRPLKDLLNPKHDLSQTLTGSEPVHCLIMKLKPYPSPHSHTACSDVAVVLPLSADLHQDIPSAFHRNRHSAFTTAPLNTLNFTVFIVMAKGL